MQIRLYINTKNRFQYFVQYFTMTETEVLVNVEQGQLRGKVENDYAGRQFYSFMGIPYAQPPLGELRFKV